tara:strand:+ start:370 stop:594 length:225 start_codon:yes stop_codon:yes gene_type:complete
MLTIDQLIASLTLEHAQAYAAKQDKFVFVTDELLDPNDLSYRHANRVEDELDRINSAAAKAQDYSSRLPPDWVL